MNIESLAQKLIDDGVAQVGTCNLEGLLPERYKNLPYGISLVYKLSDAIIDEVSEMNSPTFAYFHHYRSVNAFLDRATLYLVAMIERQGYKAMPVGASQSVKDMGEYSGIFQHKTVAVHSGLGWIGKSALFVSPIYGPRVRLATVITDMPLDRIEHAELNNLKMGCFECKICSSKCPAMAIKGNNFIVGESKRSDIFDPQACSDYMKRAYKNIGRGAVCGICMAECPYGKIKKK